GVARDERRRKSAERVAEPCRHGPCAGRRLETDELARVVRKIGWERLDWRQGRRWHPVARHTARRRQQPVEPGLMHSRTLLRGRRATEVAKDLPARDDVPGFVLDAAREDPSGRRLVDRIGALEMLA